MLYLLAIILPPLAVLLTGRPLQALLNLLLTMLLWTPASSTPSSSSTSTKPTSAPRSTACASALECRPYGGGCTKDSSGPVVR